MDPPSVRSGKISDDRPALGWRRTRPPSNITVLSERIVARLVAHAGALATTQGQILRRKIVAFLSFVPNVNDEKRQLIVERLGAIEAGHGVRILFAVEGGSRAWGFPSPDSGYDVRFVYAHPVDWYLAVAPGRDVIEHPINDDLDISGWDIRRALKLLLKPNPVVFEWLSSPVGYLGNNRLKEKLIALSEKTAYASACLHHYLQLGETRWQQHIGGRTQLDLKNYFDVLRPALAIRWVRLNPDRPPPMNIQAMSNGLDLGGETLREIAQLLALNSTRRETADGDRIPLLDRLIEDELAYARTSRTRRKRHNLSDEANTLFREIVGEPRDS